MKKLICTLFIMLLFFSGCILSPLTAYADETKAASSEEKTDTSETETEAPSGPVILPTDKVSTEDIILYSSAACVMTLIPAKFFITKTWMTGIILPASRK